MRLVRDEVGQRRCKLYRSREMSVIISETAVFYTKAKPKDLSGVYIYVDEGRLP